jgi:hypothetical protein
VIRILEAFPGWPLTYVVRDLNLLNLAALAHYLTAARAADREAARAQIEELRRGPAFK